MAEDDEKMRKEKMKNIYGSNKIEHYVLNNDVEIPAVAFGTYKAADGKSADVIRAAIGAGYRYFDTASFYGTETYLAEAIRESGIVFYRKQVVERRDGI